MKIRCVCYLTTVNEDEGTTARMYAASAAEKNA